MTAQTSAAASPQLEAIGEDAEHSSASRSMWTIAVGAGIASFAMNFWWPFLPLYARQLGATSDANALFWVAMATSGTGVARLVSGPIWGVLSDRYGRKLMFVRALYAATITTVIAAAATAPWHIALALSAQGLFSGFIPAAIALTSVSVPGARLGKALAVVTGAQYAGTTLGPAAGAGLAVGLGYRGAIIAAAIMPAVAATAALLFVPRDRLERQPAASSSQRASTAQSRGRLRRAFGGFSGQFYLAILLYFALFALNQLVRLATPIALEDLEGKDHAKALGGIAFSAGGFGSVVGALVIANTVRPGRMRWSLCLLAVACGAAHLLLAAATGGAFYIVAFGLISAAHGAMLPATNTLIASGASAARRGTAFGLASSAQAIAFMVGPLGAAAFAAVSLSLGFVVVGMLFALVGVMLLLTLREPELIE